VSNNNSGLCCYFQSPRTDEAKNALINEICCQIVQEPLAMQLGSVEQLGYVCVSSFCVKADVVGVNFLVVSSSKSTSYIKASLNRQLEILLQKVKKMTKSEFDKYKTAVKTKLTKTDKS